MFPSVELLERTFADALSYDEFVALGAADGHQMQWDERYGRLELDAAQQSVVAGFVRPMKVLCLTGTWCGDCALQGAAMQRVAEAAPELVDLRYVLRSDEHAELVVASRINAGFRVPVTYFMAEDFAPLSRLGDRTLSRYRSMTRKLVGDGVVVAEPPADPVRAVLGEVLDEFERTQLMLRLSPRWCAKYGDAP